MSPGTPGTVDDLYRIKRMPELVNGRIVDLWPTEPLAGHAAGEILVSLRAYERGGGSGRAVGGNTGFLVDRTHRKSFCPDAAFTWDPPRG